MSSIPVYYTVHLNWENVIEQALNKVLKRKLKWESERVATSRELPSGGRSDVIIDGISNSYPLFRLEYKRLHDIYNVHDVITVLVASSTIYSIYIS